MPAISVVVISRNRRESLLASLGRLGELPERPPIVVVDNGSGDGTPDAVRRSYPSVRLIEAGTNLGSAGRTLGVHAARTPYVAFADDDSWWAPGALAAATDLFAACPRLAVLAARVLVGEEGCVDPVCAAMAVSPLGRAADLPGPSVLGFLACGAVVRRSAYLDVGGFHPRFGVGGEEELLAIDLARRGHGLAYVHAVVAHHHPSPARDPVGRRRTQVRNELWTALLRRPAGTVARQLTALGHLVATDPAVRAGAAEALRGFPWVLAQRAVVPPALEEQLRKLNSSRASCLPPPR